jgi:hypothetical protein
VIVGALAGRGRARVDDRSGLAVVGERWTLDWWIGADDRWRVPAREVGVRSAPLGAAAVAETRMRIPAGDAVQRVYGIGGPGGLVVVEVENDSPAAFVAAFVVRGARSVALDGARLEVDGRAALVLPFPPPRWSVASNALDPETVGRDTGSFPARRDRGGRLHAALLYPLSHRNRLRIVVATGEDPPGPVDLALVPSADSVAHGWAAQLERGMRVVMPDDRDQDAVDLARSQVLLDPDPDAAAAAALEDWGFDGEAEWAWRGLSWRARRTAARRRDFADAGSPGAQLVALRAALVRDGGPGLELLPAPRAEWRGRDLEVHAAPTRHGTVGFALRWHGDRPALLWEVAGARPDLVISAPGLDPGWSTTRHSGEALLDPPPRNAFVRHQTGQEPVL